MNTGFWPTVHNLTNNQKGIAMRRKHETINGNHISVWFSKDSNDCYTVVYLDTEDNGDVDYLAMSADPFGPQGFCQHGVMPLSAVQYRGRGGAFDKRIKFTDLPVDCQKAVLQDLKEGN
jgi:hypothetical protein